MSAQTPGGEGLQHLQVGFASNHLGQSLRDPPVEVGETLVAGGEDAGGDQNTAQMIGGHPMREAVEALMAERNRAGGERSEQLPGRGVIEPDDQPVGAGGLEQLGSQR